MNSRDKLFKCAKESYENLNNHNVIGLPDSFTSLSQAQQDFFIDFFDFCKEVEYEEKEKEDCMDEFMDKIAYKLGESGKTTVENIIYNKNLKIIRDS